MINLGKIKDLTGEVFGKLKVIEITPERRNRQVVWKCECECGNTTYVVGQALRTGHTKSCGCLNYEKKDIDSLVGKTFGKLTVIKRSDYSFNNKIYWTCECECGRQLDVLGTDLRNESISACGECRNYNYHYTGLTGVRCGLLTVLEPVGRDNGGHYIWNCQCDCGGYAEISSAALLSGNTMSCGCLKNHSIGEAIINNYLIDMKYNFKRQITFNNCLSPKQSKLKYDFGIYDENNNLLGLIEYDGIQHFRPVEYFGGIDAFNYLQECDIIKNDYATKNHIPLLRIKYSDKSQIIKILDDWIGENTNACL